MRIIRKTAIIAVILIMIGLIFVNTTSQCAVEDIQGKLKISSTEAVAGGKVVIKIVANSDINLDNDNLLVEFQKNKIKYIESKTATILDTMIMAGNRENHPSGPDGVSIVMTSTKADKVKIKAGTELATITFEILEGTKDNQTLNLVHYKKGTKTQIAEGRITIKTQSNNNNNGNNSNNNGSNNNNNGNNNNNNGSSNTNNVNNNNNNGSSNNNNGNNNNNNGSSNNNNVNNNNNNGSNSNNNGNNNNNNGSNSNNNGNNSNNNGSNNNNGNNNSNNGQNGNTSNSGQSNINYQMIEASSLVWVHGSNKNLIFRSNAGFEKFVNVSIDGEVLANDYFDARAGSIVVEVKADFLNTLKEGTHKINIKSTDGNTTAEFKVEKAKKLDNFKPTGASLGIITIIVAVVALTIGMVIYIRKKNISSI